MTHSIKLGFIGSYKIDLLHYFSRVLRAMNKSVVIVDASEEQYLVYTIPHTIEDKVSFQGVDYITNLSDVKRIRAIDLKKYDIVLIDYGLNDAMSRDYESCTILFVVTDFNRHHILPLQALMSEAFNPSIKVVKVYRDIVNSTVTKQYIDFILDIERKAKVLAEYAFDLQEEDYQCKLLCQYNDEFEFNKMPKPYKQMFADIIEELYHLKYKDALKVVKAAGKEKLCK